MTRSFMLEQLCAEYVTTARVKGMSERAVIWRHAFRNIGVQLMTVIALSYANLLEGSVLTEIIFSLARDRPVHHQRAAVGGHERGAGRHDRRRPRASWCSTCSPTFSTASSTRGRNERYRRNPSDVVARLAADRHAHVAPSRPLASFYQGWLTFRSNTLAMVGLGILVALLLIAAFAPWLAPHDPLAQDLADRLQPLGTPGHVLGTDSLGRDILSRLIYGARITLYIVALVALIAPIVGLIVGTVAGYAGGWIDTVLMRITDIFLAFPRLVLALAFVAALGAGIENAVLAISLTAWPPYARIARAETLTIRNSDYISAVRLQGAGALRIITRHIWPLCISSLIVRVTLDMAGIILAAAGLGFLGLGAQPPLPEWGAMISDGRPLHPRQLVGRDHAGPGDLHRVAWLQPAGRRAARRARPEGREMTDLLDVQNLRVTFPTRTGDCSTPCAASAFDLGRERLGIVGESGSGKSMTGRAILRLIRPPGIVEADHIKLDGEDLLKKSPTARCARSAASGSRW